MESNEDINLKINNSKKIGIIKEATKRRPITFDTANLYNNYELIVEESALETKTYDFSKYKNISFKTRNEVLNESDVIITVNGITDDIKKDVIIVELDTNNNINNFNINTFPNTKIYNLTKMPRVSRAQSMDILSSQANLVGYRAVIEGAYMLNKVFPLMMTSAGTIPASRVLVVGAGVAGLQAIATAKRLGCIVSAFDVREAVKEQVESLGATFINMENKSELQNNMESKTGYAKEAKKDELILIQETLAKHISKQDLIITTAKVYGKEPPLLITSEMLNLKKKEAIIIDIANSNVSKGESVYVMDNILDKVSNDASRMLSKNVSNFLNLLFENPNDELVQSCLVK